MLKISILVFSKKIVKEIFFKFKNIHEYYSSQNGIFKIKEFFVRHVLKLPL
jgi:hypothetical protein